MKIYAVPILAVLTMSLAGCSSTFYSNYKDGKPLVNFPYKAENSAMRQRNFTDCKIEAVQRVPQHIVSSTMPTYTTPVQTRCNTIGTQVFCNTTGGQTYGGQTYTSDTNAGLRKQAFVECLVDHGYRFVTIPACPLGTTQYNLDSSNGLQPLSSNTCYIAFRKGGYRVGTLVY
ncbi:hypothetical protein [Celerinatantimonas sp. MCCC 1A17872]|uniref:hypothetical protein n=1 Tax=Celerinatantimonas sp. MCCC 1A17872 TaxID=3177514 RepID=UPI0038C9B452